MGPGSLLPKRLIWRCRRTSASGRQPRLERLSAVSSPLEGRIKEGSHAVLRDKRAAGYLSDRATPNRGSEERPSDEGLCPEGRGANGVGSTAAHVMAGLDPRLSGTGNACLSARR
jgi:hypothetical protein